MQLTIAEKMLYSTVKLTASKSGIQKSTGTGFFMRFAVDGEKHVPTIVTNKHVILGNDQVMAICHIAKDDDNAPSGTFVNCNMGCAPNMVFLHPDPTVDLCAIPIASILNQIHALGKKIFFTTLGFELIPPVDDWQYYDAIEDVTMVGCPNGISDQTNNLPIVRRGITATSLGKLYNGKPEFMVDMACFPGSSGSPIFIYDRDGYLDRKTNSHMMGKNRVQLVGILYAGPQITNKGNLVLAQPPQISIASMMHLGNAIRSTELHALDALIKSKTAVI